MDKVSGGGLDMNTARTIALAGLVLCGAGAATAPATAGDATSSWSGLYIGANLGYGQDTGVVETPMKPDLAGLPPDFPPDEFAAFYAVFESANPFPAAMSPSAKGLTGGGQVGYNWELPSGWVVGLEGDLQASDINGSTTVDVIDPTGFDPIAQLPAYFDSTRTTVAKKLDWDGTVRARAGYLVDPQLMIYATGGVAFGKSRTHFSTLDLAQACDIYVICADTTSDSIRLGWTVGAGIEAMLTPNWSAKAEYLYTDLGKDLFTVQTTAAGIVFDVSAAYHQQIVRVGLNYHFD